MQGKDENTARPGRVEPLTDEELAKVTGGNVLPELLDSGKIIQADKMCPNCGQTGCMYKIGNGESHLCLKCGAKVTTAPDGSETVTPSEGGCKLIWQSDK